MIYFFRKTATISNIGCHCQQSMASKPVPKYDFMYELDIQALKQLLPCKKLHERHNLEKQTSNHCKWLPTYEQEIYWIFS